MGEMQGRDQQVYLAKLAEQVCLRLFLFSPFFQCLAFLVFVRDVFERDDAILSTNGKDALGIT